MRKKILAAILSACMMLALMPTAAFAADVDPNDANGDGYHDGDVAVINKIIEDSGTDHMAKDDPANWHTRHIAWNEETPKRIIGLYFGEFLQFPEEMDLSGLTELKNLFFIDQFHNDKELDLSQNTKLEYLSFAYSKVTQLDLSHNTALKSLLFTGDDLESLNISNCRALEDVYLSQTLLNELDLSNFSALETIKIEVADQLTSINVSGCTALQKIECERNKKLSSLNAGGCTALTKLLCYENGLTELNVDGCTALTELACYEGGLTELNVDDCAALEKLDVGSNQLKTLDISQTGVTAFGGADNPLTDLKLSTAAGGGSLTISTEPNDAGSVTITAFQLGQIFNTYDPSKDGDTTLKATPAESSAFLRWEDASGNSLSTDAEYSFKLDFTKDIELTAVFRGKAAAPVLPAAGSFTESKEIEITCADADAIYYTTDGSTPTASSTRYTAPFTITDTTTVKAIAVKTDCEDSDVVSATYTKAVPGSGGSHSTRYDVTVPKALTGGAVTAKPARASRGETVTLTAMPERGYGLESLTATDKKGAALKLTDKGDGVFTFVMPASDVSVQAAFSTAAHVCPGAKFGDVDTAQWYHNAVDFAVETGLMHGTEPDEFAPNGTTSRGMIAAILYRLDKQPAVTGACPFDDVASGAYYENAVTWAQQHGIVTGYGANAFGPEDPITREQLAAILYRYAQYKGADVTAGEDSLRAFADADSVSAYAAPAMRWAVSAGVMGGNGDGTLTPTGTATRAEAAQMLMRLCETALGK